jgi:hypothetical protein
MLLEEFTLRRSQNLHQLMILNLMVSSQHAREPQVRSQVSTAERLEPRELQSPLAW